MRVFCIKQLLCMLSQETEARSIWTRELLWKSVRLLNKLFAVLPRWLAPASHSRSSWKTALSEIFFIFTKCQDVRCLSALRQSCLSSVCLSCNVTFFSKFWLYLSSHAEWHQKKIDTTSGTTLKIKLTWEKMYFEQ